jgi:hypothetical protein
VSARIGERGGQARLCKCRFSDGIGCDGAITPEVLRRINWTMVLAIPWYWAPWNKVPTTLSHMSNPYFGGDRYVRPIDSSSRFC